MKLKVTLFSILIFLFVFPIFAQEEAPPVKSTEEARSLKDQLETFQGPIDSKDIVQKYIEISDLWEQMARNLQVLFHEVPSTNENAKESNQEEAIKDWSAEVSKRFSILRQAGRARIRHLGELQNQKISPFSVDKRTFNRMVLELVLIPYKFLAYFYEKGYWIKSQLSGGYSGIFKIILEALIVFALLLIPLVFVRISSRVTEWLETRKRKSFYLSYQSKIHRILTGFLPVVIEYLPWVFTYFALIAISELLLFSEFSEFSVLIPYGKYFVFYKLFRVSLELVLRDFASNLTSKSNDQLNKKIQRTSRVLGGFLFGIYSIKTAFQSILGKSLIFNLIEPFFGFFIVVLLFIVSSRWEKEIEDYLKNTNIIMFQKYSNLMMDRFALVLSLPGVLLIIIHFALKNLIEWGEQFEFVKLIYARVLRVKYESTRDDAIGLSLVGVEYQDQFIHECGQDWQSFLDEPFFKKIKSQVEQWDQDFNFEQTVAVYGAKGSGKSIFLRQVEKYYSDQNFKCLFIDVPARVFTEKGFNEVFQPILEIKENEKAIVFLDNTHNLFLSTIGGFKVYQSFLEKTEELKNIFWIATYNDFAWQFLNSVLGKNQYFRLELEMPKWTADEIKAMVLKFHKKLGYSLVYDQIFRSSQRLNEEVASAETRYFYLIWEKSGGSPGLAIYYWFKSLRVLGAKSLKVCLPLENPTGELSKLHQEMHFVYACLMKHENLNISEAARATNLPRPVVKQAVYRGIEEGFLVEDKGRYSFSLF